MQRYKATAHAYLGTHRIQRVIEAESEDEAIKIASRQLDADGHYYLTGIVEIGPGCR